MSKTTPAHLLLVHGAWHGSWCWDRLIPELTATGWDVHTVDLPSASGAAPHHGMHDDAAVIRAAVDALDGPVVILAHSYGGIPATQAAAGAANVVRLIYLCAFQLEEGRSLASGRVASTDGLIPLPADPHQFFYTDLPAEQAQRAIARLRPQSVRSFDEELTVASWRTIPSVYIVCEQDQAISLSRQERMATRSGTRHVLPTAHSPFLSAPAELAALLAEYATAGEQGEQGEQGGS